MKKLSGVVSGTWRSWRSTTRSSSIAAASLPVLGLHDQHILLGRREQLVHGEVRQQNAIVVLAGNRRRRALHDADHLDLGSRDSDVLCRSRLPAEQRLVDIVADHGHRHAMLILGVGEEAAGLHLDLAAAGIRFVGAADLGSQIVIAFVARRGRMKLRGTDTG